MSKDSARDDFRNAVFERDGDQCVVCKRAAKDAHHLYERKLWVAGDLGGYILDNGVSLCESCHLEAEATLWSVEELAALAGIKRVPLPPILESGHIYDKWGNLILPDGKRMIGPLYYDDSVQKILSPLRHDGTFSTLTKYPRTPHLPWSKGSEDDIVLAETFFNMHQRVVITEKMDGENTTVYRHDYHARSVDSGYHASQTWVKNSVSKWQHLLGETERVVGENLYAVHSLRYDDLPSYFLGISFWVGNMCQPWHRTLELFEILEVTPVPVLFEGTWGEALDWVQNYSGNPLNDRIREGYVVRAAEGFDLVNFHKRVAKYVRPNHVTTDSHWKQGKLDKNGIRTL